MDVRTNTFLASEDPQEYMYAWIEKWCERPTTERVHLFIHALGPFPTTWYLDAELHQCTRHWEILKENFIGTFGRIGGSEALDEAL